MNWQAAVLDCAIAVIGGMLGASVSALGGFVLFGLLGVLGVSALLAAHSGVWIQVVTGSVLLKPSVCFLGGVIATAYARKRGLIRCGKDIGRPFLSYRRFDLLAVGGCAGLAGHLTNRGLDALLAGRADTVALTVFLIPLLVKHGWMMTKTNDCEASSHAVPSPYRFFEKLSKPRARTLLCVLVGACTPLLTYALFRIPETRPFAGLFAFCVSAVLLFPLFMGIPVPATHHFSGPAGAAAMLWLSLHGANPGLQGLMLLSLWGTVSALAALLAASVLEKRFFTEGDIHVDPPAMGILGATAMMSGVLPLTGIYQSGALPQVMASLLMILAALVLNLREARS